MKTFFEGKNINVKLLLILLPVLLLMLNSCIGLSLDIKINRDGSGTLTFEYRVSRSLESLGSLDGNASKLAIPVGREDWEKTIQRINGASIASFSAKQSGQDTAYTIKINFDNPQTLRAIIDPSGEKTQIAVNNNSGKLKLILLDKAASAEYDRNLLDLARVLFKDYNFSISFSAHGNSTLSFTNGQGREIARPENAPAVQSGRQVSMSIGTMDLIELPDGLGVEFNW